MRIPMRSHAYQGNDWNPLVADCTDAMSTLPPCRLVL